MNAETNLIFVPRQWCSNKENVKLIHWLCYACSRLCSISVFWKKNRYFVRFLFEFTRFSMKKHIEKKNTQQHQIEVYFVSFSIHCTALSWSYPRTWLAICSFSRRSAVFFFSSFLFFFNLFFKWFINLLFKIFIFLVLAPLFPHCKCVYVYFLFYLYFMCALCVHFPQAFPFLFFFYYFLCFCHCCCWIFNLMSYTWLVTVIVIREEYIKKKSIVFSYTFSFHVAFSFHSLKMKKKKQKRKKKTSGKRKLCSASYNKKNEYPITKLYKIFATTKANKVCEREEKKENNNKISHSLGL